MGATDPMHKVSPLHNNHRALYDYLGQRDYLQPSLFAISPGDILQAPDVPSQRNGRLLRSTASQV